MSSGLDVQPLSKAKRKVFADLGTRAGRNRHDLFLLEGWLAIEDAVSRGVEFLYLILRDDALSRFEVWTAREQLGSAVIYVSAAADFSLIAQTTTPQGIIAVGNLPTLDLAALPIGPPGLTLLADGVRDPGNLGTLLRTLAGVGGRTALLPTGTVDPFNPKALRGAAGSGFTLDIAAGMTRSAAVEWCAAHQLPVVVLEVGAPDLFQATLPSVPLALAVGNEAAGVSDEIKDHAALVVGLPMSDEVESLSAAVAGSVALYVVAHNLGRRGVT
jgi:TrmH family RNA methyltransferase